MSLTVMETEVVPWNFSGAGDGLAMGSLQESMTDALWAV
jgi:hypothetical protein